MGIHFREQRSFVETPAGFIARLEDMIEELIAMRDQLDGDPDLEDGHDAEDDTSENEAGLNELWDTQSQDIAPHARGTDIPDDDEDGHDAEADRSDEEASLGWAESESLTGELRGGSYFGEDEDGDEDADIADQPHDWDELEESCAGATD